MINNILQDKIITYYINGLSRSEIAENLHVATGTVSNTVKEYKQKLKLYDLKEIRKYTKEIRKSGIIVKECAQACLVLEVKRTTWSTNPYRVC